MSEPGLDVTAFHDLDERNILLFRARYEPILYNFLVDFTTTPPQYKVAPNVQMAEAEAGFTHAFSERFQSLTAVGATGSQRRRSTRIARPS